MAGTARSSFSARFFARSNPSLSQVSLFDTGASPTKGRMSKSDTQALLQDDDLDNNPGRLLAAERERLKLRERQVGLHCKKYSNSSISIAFIFTSDFELQFELGPRRSLCILWVKSCLTICTQKRLYQQSETMVHAGSRKLLSIVAHKGSGFSHCRTKWQSKFKECGSGW